MLKIIYARIKQKYQTIKFPKKEPVLPERFRGLPIIDSSKCNGCKKCEKNCPTGALKVTGKEVSIDLGKCLFCRKCLLSCPENVISFSQDYKLAARRREDLIYFGKQLNLAQALDNDMKKLFGRSLKLRFVSAAGCNGCELDTQVLNTPVFDLSRFGIQFVASPRHADGLVVAGPVSKNMQLALKKTYDSIANPKIVIAVGACAISGGPYIDHSDVCNGAECCVPVDLYIPGCPPHPLTILDGILRLLGKR